MAGVLAISSFDIPNFDGTAFSLPDNNGNAEVTEVAIWLVHATTQDNAVFKTTKDINYWETTAGSSSGVAGATLLGNNPAAMETV